MSEHSTASTIATDIAVGVAIVIVYATSVVVAKKVWKAGVALKTSKFSKVKP